MPEQRIYLTEKGRQWVEEHTPEGASKSAFVRACLSLLVELDATDETGLVEKARKRAKTGKRVSDALPGTAKRENGKHAGLTPQDVNGALQEEGSIRRAARELGVSRAAVRQMMNRHGIDAPI